MGRRLFCELGPWAYWLSVRRCRLQRRLQDAGAGIQFARTRLPGQPLPCRVYRASSLICRTLGRVDTRLQQNKRVNLALTAPRLNGVLIRPGETLSFWRLAGPCTAKRGYLEGLVIEQGRPDSDIGGGMCQMTNLIHWLVLHAPLTITEHHHHDGVDLFPDHGRRVPFGTGTSIFYNYLDYRVKNETQDTYQLLIWLEGGYLKGELRASALPQVRFHVRMQDEHFVREEGQVYRCGRVIRTAVDRRTGCTVERQVIKENHAQVLYDTSGLEIQQ